MASVEAVIKTDQQITNRFASLWLKIVITVFFSITSQMYTGKNRTSIKQRNQKSWKHRNSDGPTVNCINYKEEYNYHYVSSEDNYVAPIESSDTNNIAPQNKTLTIRNRSDICY